MNHNSPAYLDRKVYVGNNLFQGHLHLQSDRNDTEHNVSSSTLLILVQTGCLLSWWDLEPRKLGNPCIFFLHPKHCVWLIRFALTC